MWAGGEPREKIPGIEPQSMGCEYCDAKTIIDDPHSIITMLSLALFAVATHVHIANKILQTKPHVTNYYGSKKITGDFKKALCAGGQASGLEIVGTKRKYWR